MLTGLRGSGLTGLRASGDEAKRIRDTDLLPCPDEALLETLHHRRLPGAAADKMNGVYTPALANPKNALDAYVAKPDPAFAWREVGKISGAGYHGAVLELTSQGGELVVLPTYTAMLGMQRILAARGLARPYWERNW